MNWIAAYINAVKTNLPQKQKDDLGDELQSLLEERFVRETDKQPEDASEEELLAWIRAQENPALVASRYLERRNLIGEESFPLFKITLRYVLLGLVVAYVSIAIIQAFSTGNYSLSLFDLAGKVIHSGLTAFAVVTLIFHFFGSKLTSAELLSNWNPKDLPNPNNNWEHVPWSTSVSSLVFTFVFLLLVNGILGGITQSFGGHSFNQIEIHLLQQIQTVLPAINAVLVISILLYGFMVFKPYWSTLTLAVSILVNLATLIIAYQLRGYEAFIELTQPSATPEKDLTGLLSVQKTSIRVALHIVILVCAYEVARGAYRLFQLKSRRLV